MMGEKGMECQNGKWLIWLLPADEHLMNDAECQTNTNKWHNDGWTEKREGAKRE